MKYGYAIAIASNLFEAGRLREVELMIEPILREPHPDLHFDDRIMLQSLLIRSRWLQHGPLHGIPTLEENLIRSACGTSLGRDLAAELLLTEGWVQALNFEDLTASFKALRYLNRAAYLFNQLEKPSSYSWSVLGQAQAYGTLSEWSTMQASLNQLADTMPFIQDSLAQYWYNDLCTYFSLATEDLHTARSRLASLEKLNLSEGIPYSQNRLRSYKQSLIALEDNQELPAVPTKGPDKTVHFPDLICLSPAMQVASKKLQTAIQSWLPILIYGENGTGKAWLARQIHQQLLGNDAPFICLNSQEIPPELHEGSLFGRLEAETGSLSRSALTDAAGGTLFIEGVEHLSRDTQSGLSRYLESMIYKKKMGMAFPAPHFIIAATEVSLEHEIETGHFNEALLTYLSGSVIPMPPLRRRVMDIPGLVKSMLGSMQSPDIPVVTATSEVIKAFQHYNWPGNVRQLHNELERILTQSAFEPSTVIDLNLISDEIAKASVSQNRLQSSFHAAKNNLSLGAILSKTEKKVIEETLADNSGQVAASARVLGLTRQGLYKKIKRLEISLDRVVSASVSTESSS